MKRIYLVGTARSGTTLLQTILHRSGAIYSPPETHFLDYSLPKTPLLRYFWPYGKREVQKITTLTKEIGMDPMPLAKTFPFSYPGWLRYLNSVIDHNAEKSDFALWLEKTPSHLLFAPDLLRYTDANIILNYREAKDNVAALYRASNDFPDFFRQNTLEKAFRRYRRDAKIMAKVARHKRCFLANYQSIICQDETLLQSLFSFMGLSYKPEYLEPHKADTSLIQKNETWKDANAQPLKKEAKDYRDRLSEVEVETLDQLMKGYKNPIDGRSY